MKCLIFDAGGVLVYPRMGDWNLSPRLAELLGPHAPDIHTAKYLSAHRACLDWLDESRLVHEFLYRRCLQQGIPADLRGQAPCPVDFIHADCAGFPAHGNSPGLRILFPDGPHEMIIPDAFQAGDVRSGPFGEFRRFDLSALCLRIFHYCL